MDEGGHLTNDPWYVIRLSKCTDHDNKGVKCLILSFYIECFIRLSGDRIFGKLRNDFLRDPKLYTI